MSYKLLSDTNAILNYVTGETFPADEGNRHYQEYLAWIDLGNTPLASDNPPLNIEVRRQELELNRPAMANRSLIKDLPK